MRLSRRSFGCSRSRMGWIFVSIWIVPQGEIGHLQSEQSEGLDHRPSAAVHRWLKYHLSFFAVSAEGSFSSSPYHLLAWGFILI